MPSARFFKLLIVEVLVIGAIGTYLFIDSSDVYRWWVGETHFVYADPTCDLHVKSCEVKLSDGHKVLFDIEPKSIPLMKPLSFTVTSEIDLPSIEIKLFATNMNMGFHTFKLTKIAEGRYQGEGILPTCVVGNMIWEAHVIFNENKQSQGAIFTFQTDK